MTDKPRVVVCAAVKLCDDFSMQVIITGPRHWDSRMGSSAMHMLGNWKELEQGFIDQFGVFMTREEAWEVAKAAGQIKYRVPNDEGCLFSENLY